VLLVPLLGALFGRREAPVLRPVTLSATGLAMTRRLPNRPLLLCACIPLAFIAAGPALAGHAHAESPRLVMVPANVLHVVAMSAWAGGIAMLVLALPKATRLLPADQRIRLLAGVIVRFSAMAGLAIALVLASGVAQTLVLVRSVGNLLHTTYGHTLIVKLAFFAGILALGGYNRQRLVPALRRLAATGESAGGAGRLLRRSVSTELVVAAAVLSATGVLAGLAPATATTKGPYSTTTRLGPSELQLTVDPARVGSNLVHVYLFKASDGSQYDSVKELTLSWSLPSKQIGPITYTATRAGPGHFVVTGTTLGLPGRWTLKFDARISDFDAYYAEVAVPVHS
jgi:copper transport protein